MSSAATLRLTNSTISGNTVAGTGSGGGILNWARFAPATVMLDYTTVANNTATTGHQLSTRAEAEQTAAIAYRRSVFGHTSVGLMNHLAVAANGPGANPTFTPNGTVK